MKAAKLLLPNLLLAALAAVGVSAQAQTTGTTTTTASPSTSPMRDSWMPYGPGRGYIGLSAGRSRFDVDCGTLPFSCDNRDRMWKIYTGSMINNMWGVELGYIDMGNVSRAGGSTDARGVNLSVLAKAPIGAFGIFGKLGTTYGRTETTAAAGTGVGTGSEHGFGVSYGLGASYDFTPNLAAVVEWESHDFRFANSGRDPIRATSIGLQYKF